MLDVAFDSVITMDDQGIVLAANRAAERTFGYSAEEMVGQELAPLIIPPSAARGPPLRDRAATCGRAAGRSSGGGWS